jgi:hypothetical protein
LIIDNDNINRRYRYIEMRLNGFDNVLASVINDVNKLKIRGYI